MFVLLVIIAMISWAGTWTSGKIIADMAPLETMIFWRFVISAISLFLLMIVVREPVQIPRSAWWGLFVSGVLYTSYNHFFFLGVRSGLAGTGGVIVASLNPVLTFIAMLVVRRRRPALLETMGVILGITGGAILLRLWRFSVADLLSSGNLFYLLAALSWSAITLLSQRVQHHVSFMTYSAVVCLISALLNLPSALRGGIWPVDDRPVVLWGNVLFLATIAMAFASTVFFRASRRLGAERAASFIFLVPALAPIISWLVIGEVPEVSTLVGGPIAIGAVYLINSGRPRDVH